MPVPTTPQRMDFERDFILCEDCCSDKKEATPDLQGFILNPYLFCYLKTPSKKVAFCTECDSWGPWSELSRKSNASAHAARFAYHSQSATRFRHLCGAWWRTSEDEQRILNGRISKTACWRSTSAAAPPTEDCIQGRNPSKLRVRARFDPHAVHQKLFILNNSQWIIGATGRKRG